MKSWKIIQLRKKYGDTRAEFARRLGICFETLWRWEEGKAVPRGLYAKELRKLHEKISKRG